MAIDIPVHAVILAGGRGERFWPRSRAARPKQLQALTGGKTMIEETLARISPLSPASRQWIITSEDLVPAIRALVGSEPQVIGEPAGRNTAPAIALAASEIAKRDPQAVMLVLPSDHHISDSGRFRQVLQKATGLAQEGYLVTIGLVPERPETGYGYIERGQEIAPECFRVKRFREKPDAATAAAFVASGNFFWNGGIFIWKAAVILEHLARHLPSLHQATVSWQQRGGLDAGPEELKRYFVPLEKISIDYGVMEKASQEAGGPGVAVVRGDFGWDDLGSWEAAGRYYPADTAGNRAAGMALAVDAADNIVVCDEGLVALLGVNDLVVVRSGNAVMVCRRDRVQEVRRLVEELARRNMKEYL